MIEAPSPQLIERLGIEKLASLPQALVRLLDACNDPDTEFADLSDIIGQDAGLASKMLNVANSPLYAQWGEIRDLNRMLVVLGFGTIRTIAITSSVVDLFTRLQAGHSSFIRRFWHHTLLSAHLARKLALRTRCASPDEAYLGGLLHRVGQLVLFNNDRAFYGELAAHDADAKALLQAERQRFGIGHDSLGAWLVARWNLGEMFSDAVLYQHETGAAVLDAPDLVKLVGLASRLCAPATRAGAAEDAAWFFGLGEPDLPQLQEEAEQELLKAAETFGVDLEAPPMEEAVAESAAVPAAAHGELAALVQDSVLLDSARSAMWDEARTREPVSVVPTFLNILFGLPDVLVFVVDDSGRLRAERADSGARWLEQLRIPVEAERSLLCAALVERRPLNSFDYRAPTGTLNVIDRQIIRHQGRAGLLAVPLVAEDQALGVLAVGVEPGALDLLGRRRRLLEMFSAEAAKLMLSRRRALQEQERLIAESRADMLRQVRRIRHEANNPLGIIQNYLHILGTEFGAENRAPPELEIIRDEISRVEKILRGLTERLDQTPSPGAAFDLNTTVSQLVTMLRPSLFDPTGIGVGLDLDDSLPRLEADRDKIKQLLLNLLRNAAEAMPEGGEVTVQTRDNVLDGRGNFVEILIRDTGPGLPQAVREQLFQPVVSSKGGDHSGLGLSICAQLVRDMQGSIRCRTGRGGTEFVVLIPRVKADAVN